uniref:Uncharacterized protein n=1 Tax=Aegilops tauschii subsp. strangulata TaxID=200361 RepID=A0A453DCY7_AEGTS
MEMGPALTINFVGHLSTYSSPRKKKKTFPLIPPAIIYGPPPR